MKRNNDVSQEKGAFKRNAADRFIRQACVMTKEQDIVQDKKDEHGRRTPDMVGDHNMSYPKLSNPIDPTPDDLRLWAYTPNADYPDEMEQDWDLCIISFDRAALFLEFASDEQCPNRDFFLGCLYTMAGDCVRTKAGQGDIPKLRAALASVSPNCDRLVRLWAQRTEYLLAHPESYDYDRWGWGDFARDETP